MALICLAPSMPPLPVWQKLKNKTEQERVANPQLFIHMITECVFSRIFATEKYIIPESLKTQQHADTEYSFKNTNLLIIHMMHGF